MPFHTLNYSSRSPLDDKAGARPGGCEASLGPLSESGSDHRCPAQTFQNVTPTCSLASCVPCCLRGGLETWKHFSQLPAYFRGKKHAGRSDDSFGFIAGDDGSENTVRMALLVLLPSPGSGIFINIF